MRQRGNLWTIFAALLVTLSLLPSAGLAAPRQSAPAALPILSSASSAGESPAAEGAPTRLLASTETEIAFEVNVPWEQLVVAAAEDAPYVRLSLPGYAAASQAGAPELPFLVELIGIPLGVTLAVRVEPGAEHTLALTAPVVPAAAQSVQWDPAARRAAPLRGLSGSLPQPLSALHEDPEIYGSPDAYPGTLAEVAGTGMLRQQRVAGIALYPVQYRPAAGVLTLYASLRVTVAFAPADRVEAVLLPAAVESPQYEQVYRASLLNYESARPWRQRVPAQASASGSGSDAAAWSPPVPGWRVKVRADGLYRLTYADLQASGLPVDDLDPATLQLFQLGQEVAVEVAGEADGSFDPGDSLLFYGRALDSKYTWDNVYWLTYGGAAGLRISARDGTPGSAETPASYPALRHMEENVDYITDMPGDEALERFLWDWLYPPSRPSWSHTFSLAAPYVGSGTATLTVAMQGFLSYPVDPDHHAQVYLNGTLVQDAWWDGIAWLIEEVPFDRALLAAGDNTITVAAPNDTGAGADGINLDWAELRFANTFLAEGDELAFTYDVAGDWQFRVEGFSTDQLVVYDVSDPGAPVRIEGVSAVPSGAGYAALFEEAIAGPTGYWVAATGTCRSAEAIEQDTPSDLQAADNGADYVVVTHAAFEEQAGTLAGYRASQGLRAVTVDVQDVYDEFGYGIVGAVPIHDFLAYAYDHWQAPAPSFVVLLGDGHFDPKDHYAIGETSYLPPYLAPVDPWMIETAADNRYVTLAGDDTLPDMMLGRLSVDTGAGAEVLVQKIVDYEQSPPPGTWTEQVLAVADNADGAGDFAAASDALLVGYLPQPYQAHKVYLGVTHPTPEQARAAIQAQVNAGALIVNYIGHAAVTTWAGENLLTTDDVPLLQNGGMLPVMLPMTCWDGYFIFPFPSDWGMDSMAEVVTRAEGRGAVASWSPTGMGISSGHDSLDTGFFQAIFLDGVRSLGEATTAGKLRLWATGSNRDLVDTYQLFGDPATRIRALDADLQVAKTVTPSGPVTPGTVLNYTLTFTNQGPATAHHVVLSDPVPAQLLNPQVVQASPGVVLRPGTTFVWDVRDLVPGATGIVKLRGKVSTALLPPYTIVNSAQVEAAEPDLVPGNNSASASTDVLGKMHLGAINLGYVVVVAKYRVTAASRVLDMAGRPVASATVSMRWTLPNGSTVDQQALSRTNGAVTFRVTSAQAGTYQVCVTDIAKAGYLYDPAADVETCDTISVP